MRRSTARCSATFYGCCVLAKSLHSVLTDGFCGSSPLSCFLGELRCRTRRTLDDAPPYLLLQSASRPRDIKAAAKNLEKQNSCSRSLLFLHFQPLFAALITVAGAAVQLRCTAFVSQTLFFYAFFLLPPHSSAFDLKKLLFLLHSAAVSLTCRRRFMQVRLLAHSHCICGRRRRRSPSAAPGLLLRACLIVSTFCGSSQGLQSNHTNREEPHPGRWRHSC